MTQIRTPISSACAAVLTMAAMPCLLPASAHAETQLFSAETIKAWADVRLTSGEGERSWTRGGFGKTRYGDGDAGAHLAQAALLWQPRLLDTVTAYVLVQSVPDSYTPSGKHNPLGVEEAYIKWKPVPTGAVRYSLRAGQMFPPVSQEHDGVGWTSSRTLTPSAINSWIGEEVLVDGVEGTVTVAAGDSKFGATAGVFSRDDTAGTILAWRGWALHDISSADSTGLALPDGDDQGWYQLFDDDQAAYSRPVVEIDHRLGYYVRLDWRPPAPFAVNLEFYDNQGDPEVDRNGQWGWATRFYNLGIQYQPAANWEVLGQYMMGQTAMGWKGRDGKWAVDVNFDSAYLLVSRKLGVERLTGRIDYFAARDNSRRAVDDNTDRGYAATLAWLHPLNDHLDVACEVMQVRSYRPARASHGLDPRQTQNQAQIALKLHL